MTLQSRYRELKREMEWTKRLARDADVRAQAWREAFITMATRKVKP